jgi:hypothetical protein
MRHHGSQRVLVNLAKNHRDNIGVFALALPYARGDKPFHQFLHLPSRTRPLSIPRAAARCRNAGVYSFSIGRGRRIFS